MPQSATPSIDTESRSARFVPCFGDVTPRSVPVSRLDENAPGGGCRLPPERGVRISQGRRWFHIFVR
jgi:hypothetical protein